MQVDLINVKLKKNGVLDGSNLKYATNTSEAILEAPSKV
jgi:hypothetical protein